VWVGDNDQTNSLLLGGVDPWSPPTQGGYYVDVSNDSAHLDYSMGFYRTGIGNDGKSEIMFTFTVPSSIGIGTSVTDVTGSYDLEVPWTSYTGIHTGQFDRGLLYSTVVPESSYPVTDTSSFNAVSPTGNPGVNGPAVNDITWLTDSEMTTEGLKMTFGFALPGVDAQHPLHPGDTISFLWSSYNVPGGDSIDMLVALDNFNLYGTVHQPHVDPPAVPEGSSLAMLGGGFLPLLGSALLLRRKRS